MLEAMDSREAASSGVYRCGLDAPLRQVAGGEPVARLNARLNAASDS